MEIQTTLNTLSDTEFELLLRAYLRRMTARVNEGTPFTFYIRSEAYEEELKHGYWEIGNKYSSASGNIETRGQILAEVILEHNRRCGFKSTLLQIELSPEEATTPTTVEAE